MTQKFNQVGKNMTIINGEENSLKKEIQELKEKISKLTENNKSLQDWHNLYGTIINKVPDIIIQTDLNGNIIFVNDALIQNFPDLDSDSIMGTNMISFVAEEDKARAVENTKLMFEKPLGVREYKLHLEKDKVYEYAVNGDVVRDTSGIPTGMVYVLRDITEAKKSKRALEESEVRYRKLFSTAADAIFLMDELTFIDCNSKALEMFDCKKEQILGHSPTKFSPQNQPDGSESKNKASKMLESVFAGKPQFFEWQHKKLNGVIFDAEVRLNLLVLSNKNYIQAIVRDVTERKKTERSLIESEKLSSAVLAGSPIGISVRDRNGTLILYNKSWQKIWGLSNEEVKEKQKKRTKFRLNKKDEYLGKFKDEIEEIYKKGGSFTIPEIKLKPDRKHKAKWISQQFYAISDDDNEVGRVVILTTNITETKIYEEELKRNDQRHKRLIETAAEGFWLINSKNVTIDVNRSLCKMLGHTRDEIIGKTPFEFCDEKNAKILSEQMSTPTDIKQKSYEIELTKKNGHKITVLFNATVMLNKHSKRTGAFTFVTDITQKKKAENQIKQSLREKDTLLKELYHRTKNNMQIISSMLKMKSRSLENHALSKIDNMEFVLNTFNEINHKIKAMSMVHQKLYQAKDLSHINLKDYVNDLINMLMISYGYSSDTISLRISSEKLYVLIDTAIPLGLIMNELISNIFKHAFHNSENNEIVIDLSKPANDEIKVSISDNGLGLPNDIRLEDVNTMGLQTVFSLVKYQLKGTVNYKIDNGLKWEIIIKDNLHSQRL